MHQLDTGVLICHLARIIQKKALEIIANRPDDAAGEEEPPPVSLANGSTTTTETTTTTTMTNLQLYDHWQNAAAATSSDGSKHAQQQHYMYLNSLLRGANDHATLLAAAKVKTIILKNK